MVKILCWIGIHKWFYTTKIDRCCKCCNRKEGFDYCLSDEWVKDLT